MKTFLSSFVSLISLAAAAGAVPATVQLSRHAPGTTTAGWNPEFAAPPCGCLSGLSASFAAAAFEAGGTTRGDGTIEAAVAFDASSSGDLWSKDPAPTVAPLPAGLAVLGRDAHLGKECC